MTILGIETSCDETGASVVWADEKSSKVNVLSNVVSSSIAFHEKTGGIIPEVAAREQIKYIIPVIKQALSEAKLNIENPSIDAIAVTIGPGLLGSLLVGVETAKTLSYIWKKPLIPVNHLYGHIYANFASEISNYPRFPAIALVVSGGHTDLVLMNSKNELKWLGGTRDDAAGEAFDKIGRLLNLSYPGGPSIEKSAKFGNSKTFDFPRPMIGSKDYDFSFSGLKTAVLREVKTIKQMNNETINDICASVQHSIVDVLVKKTMLAAEKFGTKSILLGGGVAANQKLREEFQSSIVNQALSIKFFAPPKNLCTDNAAMIAAAAFFNYKLGSFQTLDADPNLHFPEFLVK